MIIPVDTSKKLVCTVALLMLLMMFMGSRVAAQPRPAEFRFHGGHGVFLDDLGHVVSAGASYRRYFGERGWAIEPEYSLTTARRGHQDHLLILNVVKDLTPLSERAVPYLIMGMGPGFHTPLYGRQDFGFAGMVTGAGLGVKVWMSDHSFVSPQFRVGLPFTRWSFNFGFTRRPRPLLRTRTYEAPPLEPSQLITKVDVPLTDGDVVPRNGPVVVVSVAHASRLGRPRNEAISLTVCLSLRPDRCTSGWAVFDGPAGRLSSSVTATLRFGEETVPTDTAVPVYVHVVLTSGPSWRPTPDQAVPQLGDPGVLDVETVTRRITVVDQ